MTHRTTSYTFSGKEKDVETGYSYFGARYYDSDLSIWLSVDPMSDKYPSMSPYNYCANNPVMLVDPDGREVVNNRWGPDDPPGTNPETQSVQSQTDIPKGANPDLYNSTPTEEYYGNGKVIPPASEGSISTKPTERFPLDIKTNSFLLKPGRYGDFRNGGKRTHAGCDLYAPVGTPVYAVKDGSVIQAPYPFYNGSYAIEVNHGDFVARYCEIIPTPGLEAGDPIFMGQQLGTVANLGLPKSMLHFEMYSGKGTGPLTNKHNLPYKRRRDLINPTPFLNKWKK